MAHILKGGDLLDDFLLGQLLAGNVTVGMVVGTVPTFIDAVIGEVKRRKHDDAVAVKALLDFLGQGIHPVNQVGNLTFQQHRRFLVGKALAVLGPLQDGFDEGTVFLVLFGIIEGV